MTSHVGLASLNTQQMLLDKSCSVLVKLSALLCSLLTFIIFLSLRCFRNVFTHFDLKPYVRFQTIHMNPTLLFSIIPFAFMFCTQRNARLRDTSRILCPQAKMGGGRFICAIHRLAHLRPPCAAGLRPRGSESDQSDQSTEITVIPEVRGRAPGHAEFTRPTQAPHKSVQE